MSRRTGLATALVTWFVWVTAPDVVLADVAEGERLYRIHCLACHGESGRGEGSMREQLDIEPPDLTIIAAENGGECPTEKIRQIIDGRHVTPAHGTREMPVWGFTFQSSATDTVAEKDVQALITALTEYLESMQIESDGAAQRRAPDD